MKNSTFLLLVALLFSFNSINAQSVQVGSGSYTTVFPGVDEANRNDMPPGTPDVTGNAANVPVPTNNWWANFLLEDHGGNAFNYPLSFRSKNNGLVINYTWPLHDTANEFREPISAVDAIVVGVENMNVPKSDVADFSDWAVTLNWDDGFHTFNAQMGMGMPFVYFTKGASDVASVYVGFNPAGVSVDGNKLLIENNFSGSNYVVYAPAGSSWQQNGDTYTSSLNGKNYWSMVLVPDGQDINVIAAEYEPYAFVFPANTQVSWTYNETSSKLQSTYSVTPDIKEGTGLYVLQGLLPHQWDNLSASSPLPNGHTYKTVRGALKMMASDHFVVEHSFSGILPTLPDLGQYSDSYSPAEMFSKVDIMKSEALSAWTDSYNEGQAMNRLIQVARIADQIGHTVARDQLLSTVKDRLEDWLSYESGEVAFLFYYHDEWDALLGYPAGHLQDSNLNDHHFHWGYFIHAAAAIEQYFPGWANDWGDMVNMLVRDAASPNRADNMFPFLRSFSPFAGHCWANGFATFPFGNDQESSSESMQFNSALIHWGSVTGNNELRDLGIYLYTTEQSAIEEYWFDIHERSFQPGYAHEMVARIWGGGYDNGTFWTTDISASFGIELYPIHGGSLYLGHHPDYVQRVWNDMVAKTDVLNNTPNDNLWYDVYWKYLSFIDSEQALQLYNSYPDRNMKFGISDAQTYHWLHNMNSLGQVRNDILPDYPVAAAFDKNGDITYVAHNYTALPVTVNFSNGYSLNVPARSMATSKDAGFSVGLAASVTQIPTGGNLLLTANVNGTVDHIEFFMDGVSQGIVSAEPYELEMQNLNAGTPAFHAVGVSGSINELSPVVSVQVGSQVPYSGTPWAIPGEIEAGKYDEFEGGLGQGITYSDVTAWNEAGTFRPDEYVDAGTDANEGANVGWIEAGEWLEYTVNVAQTGNYDVEIRFASEPGGGPFHFSVNGTQVSTDVQLPATGGWGIWATHTLQDVALTQGEQIIRVVFGNGGFNLGKMNFVFDGVFTGNHAPVANAGGDKNIQLPGNSVLLDGSASSDQDGTIESYTWTKFSGPDGVVFDNANAVQTSASGLVEGTYVFRLTVTDNEGATDTDDVVVEVSTEPGTTPGGVCEGTDVSGDFSWVVQEDGGQVTMTFVPELTGVGDNTLLFYYTTTPNNPFPGYDGIDPNVPFNMNVTDGEEIYFYFTYSHPEGGERNTADRIESFTVGSCSTVTGLLHSADKTSEINVWPNPFNSDVLVELPEAEAFDNIRIFNFSGRLVHEQYCADKQIRLELRHLSDGTYLMVISGDGETVTTKLIKN